MEPVISGETKGVTVWIVVLLSETLAPKESVTCIWKEFDTGFANVAAVACQTIA